MLEKKYFKDLKPGQTYITQNNEKWLPDYRNIPYIFLGIDNDAPLFYDDKKPEDNDVYWFYDVKHNNKHYWFMNGHESVNRYFSERL